MSRTSRPSHSARPPGLDWEDSYFSLEERYRRLQQRFNEQESELKRRRVAERRAASRVDNAATLSTSGTHLESVKQQSSSRQTQRTSAKGKKSVSFATQPLTSSSTTTNTASAKDTQPHAEAANTTGGASAYVPVPPLAKNNTSNNNNIISSSDAVAGPELSMWSPELSLPDPAMIWGSEDSVRNYVAASALYHANEELRHRLAEATTLQHSTQLELAAARKGQSGARTRLEDMTLQLHQAVRERDTATAKLHSLQQTIQSLERTLQDHISAESKLRFTLEGQINELRTRLVAGADQNELLSRDLRALLNEAREHTSEAMALRSKLALAESALATQRSTNENLLVELQNMNSQLVDARKRLIATAHDAERVALDNNHKSDLESRLQQVVSERDSLEKAHVTLMGQFVQLNERAFNEARAAVQSELEDWRATATHWDEVAQLLYKDVAERTAAHRRCRDECEAAKAQRDQFALSMRDCRAELDVAQAKLAVVWPTHAADTADLSAEEIRETFRLPRHLTYAPETKDKKKTKISGTQGAAGNDITGEKKTGAEEEEEDVVIGLDGQSALRLPRDPTTRTEKLRELHEANASLVAQLAQLRRTNELLQERIDALTAQQNVQRAAQASAQKSHAQREAAGQALLSKQIDRVGFLEAQVRALRGYRVGNDISLDQIGPNELILELFLGQLVATQAAAQLYVAPEFASVFCSVDFLLHETVTTRPITGLNGFFDTTISFCISMDALLLYYLQTRDLLVQLHRVRTAAEVADITDQTPHHKSPSPDTSEDGKSSPSHTRRPLSYDSALRPTTNNNVAAAKTPDETTALAEKMFETIAEGRVSLLDLVLDEECRTASRPTLHGHVKLYTSREEHIASLEFQLTARAPFTEAFRELIAQTCTNNTSADEEAVSPTQDESLAQLTNDNEGMRNKENRAGQMMITTTQKAMNRNDRMDVSPRDELRTLQRRRTSTPPSASHLSKPHEFARQTTAAASLQNIPRDLRAWVQSARRRYRDDGRVYTPPPQQKQNRSNVHSTQRIADAGANASSLHSSYSYSYYYYTTGSSAYNSDLNHSRDSHAASVTSTFRDPHTIGSSTLYRRRFRTRHAAGDAVELYVSQKDNTPRSASAQQQQYRSDMNSNSRNLAALVDENATASSTSSLFVHHRARMAPAPPPPMRHIQSLSTSPVRFTTSPPSPPQVQQSGSMRRTTPVGNATATTTTNNNTSKDEAANTTTTAAAAAMTNLHVAHLPRYLLPTSSPPNTTPPAQQQYNADDDVSPTSSVTSELRRVAEKSLVREVRALLVDVVRVELPTNLPGEVPRLSCYYGLRALQEERWLRAPQSPRYTITYDDQGRDAETGQLGSVFAVHSLAELAAIAREPLSLFFIHDEAENANDIDNQALDSVKVWGLTTCEWAEALAEPGVAHQYSLPLLRQNAILPGATVRVRLMALVRDVLRPSSLSPRTRSASPTAATTETTTNAPPSLQQLEQELMKLELNRASRTTDSTGRAGRDR